MSAYGVSAESITVHDVGVAKDVIAPGLFHRMDYKVRIVVDKVSKRYFAAAQSQEKRRGELTDPIYYPKEENYFTDDLCGTEEYTAIVSKLKERGFSYLERKKLSSLMRKAYAPIPSPCNAEERIKKIHERTLRFETKHKEDREKYLERQEQKIADVEEDVKEINKASALLAATQQTPR